jgi:hypothetical protein
MCGSAAIFRHLVLSIVMLICLPCRLLQAQVSQELLAFKNDSLPWEQLQRLRSRRRGQLLSRSRLDLEPAHPGTFTTTAFPSPTMSMGNSCGILRCLP